MAMPGQTRSAEGGEERTRRPARSSGWVRKPQQAVEEICNSNETNAAEQEWEATGRERGPFTILRILFSKQTVNLTRKEQISLVNDPKVKSLVLRL